MSNGALIWLLQYHILHSATVGPTDNLMIVILSNKAFMLYLIIYCLIQYVFQFVQ